MAMENLLIGAINRAIWDSRRRDSSMWNAADVSLNTILAQLKREGHVAVYTPGGVRDGATFQIGRGATDRYTERIESGILSVDGVPVTVERVFSWHGSNHMGCATEDIRVVEGTTPLR